MWDRIKRWFGGGSTPDPEPRKTPEIPWIPAEDNPWGVPILDVRPVTARMLSMTEDPKCAANAVSFGGDTGLGFAGDSPGGPRLPCDLRYRLDGALLDGVLFTPREMEHKWALFFHQGRILCVRSWTRTVLLVGETAQDDGELRVTAVTGAFSEADEAPAFTVRSFDALLRTHALGLAWPVPLPAGAEEKPYDAAIWCMSLYGRHAAFATAAELPLNLPEKPLRSHSLLHIAVAQGQADDVRRLAATMPLDARAGDGLTPLQWALARQDDEMLDLLVALGAPVEARSAEGATALMNAVQERSLPRVRRFLALRADPSAKDDRGFTSLHRAAEMGEIDIARLLLEAGADPHPEALGHTPLSLARMRGHAGIAELIEAASA